jgi:protein O-mannose beta-1,4-N-acetylglucosaminyltransferase
LGLIVELLGNAKGAFGMHGSILILAIFMQPGSVLIEGFPYRVPPKHFTPYRQMCQLRGIRYIAWSNKDPSKSVGHPDRHASKGGIIHLLDTNPDLFHQIMDDKNQVRPHLCCDDPHWLYRIYQDTKVNAASISRTFKHFLNI